jgi:hypothetical protein
MQFSISPKKKKSRLKRNFLPYLRHSTMSSITITSFVVVQVLSDKNLGSIVHQFECATTQNNKLENDKLNHINLPR